ncbi:MAG: GNAT family N-acetyltransferase [Pseudonocardiaceae bacterium]|nr:GNAT family N-acetyltransferase [Pseudonocardiaceae bacterium]
MCPVTNVQATGADGQHGAIRTRPVAELSEVCVAPVGRQAPTAESRLLCRYREQSRRIIEHVIDECLRRTLALREDGGLAPVMPLTEAPERCPRGHNSKIARVLIGYSHIYYTRTVTCRVCLELGHEPATWALVDPATQVTKPAGRGLELVLTPPSARGGVGRIALHVDRNCLADADLMICGPCRIAVLEQLRVDEEVRRRGYGRLLLAAALLRAPDERYRWSATEAADTTEARAFWSRVPFPGQLGEPTYCTDMRIAAGLTPDH